MRGFGVLSLCALDEHSSFLSSLLSPFILHVCLVSNSKHNNTSIKPTLTVIVKLHAAHGDSPGMFRSASQDAPSGRWLRSEGVGGSGKASGSGPLLRAALARSATPGLTEQPKPGLNAGRASGGTPGGSWASWVEPEVEE